MVAQARYAAPSAATPTTTISASRHKPARPSRRGREKTRGPNRPSITPIRAATIGIGAGRPGTYWGPVVTYQGCGLGSQNGHLSFGAPDPNPLISIPVDRGPVNSTLSALGPSGCGNDDILVNPPAYAQPDLYFDAPPPMFGGMLLRITPNCNPCGAAAIAGASIEGVAQSMDPVITVSGALSECAADLRAAGPGIPFVWARSYSSQNATSGALGLCSRAGSSVKTMASALPIPSCLRHAWAALCTPRTRRR